MPADIKVTANAKVLQKRMQELQKRNSDLQPVYAEIAPKLVTTTQLRFKLQQTPTGKFWKRSASARRENRKTLIKSGNLLRSIEATYDKREIQVGTDEKYGRFYQVGGARAKTRRGRRLVQRKFLGIGKRDRKTMYAIIARRMKEAAGVD